MKNILTILLVVAACMLIASSSGLAFAAAPATTTTAAATAVSTEPVFPSVVVISSEGQISTLFDVPLTSIPAPGPGGSVIVTDARGTITIITESGVIWFDAGCNPCGYTCG
jgi:hypothetical protein